VAGRTLRDVRDSFCGGRGASSAKEGSPSGPKGSVESSTASNLVACALTLRAARGLRRAGDFVVAELACVVVSAETCEVDPGQR
jgi:hypothetical protein